LTEAGHRPHHAPGEAANPEVERAIAAAGARDAQANMHL
jgi:hypothetical protein